MGNLRIVLTITLVLSAMSAPLLSQPAAPSAGAGEDTTYQSLLSAWASGDVRLAERLEGQLISNENPASERTLLLDVVMSRTGIDKSERLFQRIAKLAPDSPQGRFAALDAKLREKVVPQATIFSEMKALVDANSNDAILLAALAMELHEYDREEEAIAAFDKLGSLVHPGGANVHLPWGNALDVLKKHEEALVHRRLAASLEPNGWSYSALGFTLNKLKKYDEANEAYTRAVALRPEAYHYWSWGLNLMDQNKLDDAMEKLSKAVKQEPQNGEFWNTRGACLSRQDQWDAALTDYAKAMKFAPHEQPAYRNSVRLLQNLGRDEEAKKVLDSWKVAGNTVELKL